MTGDLFPRPSLDWVDDVLLFGAADEVCLHLGTPVTRADLRSLVADRQSALAAAGLRPSGTVALHLPPSMAFVTNLLAAWRAGAQVTLLDHRLTGHEVEQAIRRLEPQLVVSVANASGTGLGAFAEVTEAVRARSGQPASTEHVLVQLSSGSTGPSKVIGRSAADLSHEIHRYVQTPGVPRAGERIVVLASMVHVLGLVGGLLYGLHAGARVVLPARTTPAGIFAAVAAAPEPATLLGVPFHVELLASVAQPPRLPQLHGMTTGGELVRADVHDAFVDRYQIRLGNMYGMTEVGVIATDLFGRHRPAVAPAPGLRLREQDGELLVEMAATPYLGLADPTRFVGGWLHTKDAGSVDPRSGLVTVRGRLDSQVSVAGLKVDLTEVEHTIASLPGVAFAVVVHDGAIEAYVVLDDPDTASRLDDELASRLAAYKRPRVVHVVDQLPRTATGKLVRDREALRRAGTRGEAT